MENKIYCKRKMSVVTETFLRILKAKPGSLKLILFLRPMLIGKRTEWKGSAHRTGSRKEGKEAPWGWGELEREVWKCRWAIAHLLSPHGRHQMGKQSRQWWSPHPLGMSKPSYA